MAFTTGLNKTDLSLLAYLCDQRLTELIAHPSTASEQESESLHSLSIKLALLNNWGDEAGTKNIVESDNLVYLALLSETLRRLKELEIVGIITIAIDDIGADIVVCSSVEAGNPYMYSIELNSLDNNLLEVIVEDEAFTVEEYKEFLENELEEALIRAFK